MRPVNKGVSPSEIFFHYKDAAAPLINRLGPYCSYCERHIETNLAVEHIIPKYENREMEKDWDNFLLGCVNCNSSKGKASIKLSEYFWPHLDNTIRYLSYKKSLVLSAHDLNSEQRRKSDSLINLVGLDKDPGNPNKARRPTNSDKRWLFRKTLCDFAENARERLMSNDNPAFRAQIVDTALSRGGFGIWFNVFRHDEDMCQRLVNAFPGTANYYFGLFGALAVPVHVLRMLGIIFEEINFSLESYSLNVVVPEEESYQRVRVDLKLKNCAENEDCKKEFKNLQSRSIWISMIEYSVIPSISRSGITVVVFEQRQLDAYSATKTRHYVEHYYEGKSATSIAFRSMSAVADDVKNFFATGEWPKMSIEK